MFSRYAAAIAAACLGGAAAFGAPASERMCGETARPDRLLFEGVKYFQADSIRSALEVDPQYLSLSASEKPLKPCLDHLLSAVISGYARAGMPVAASADLDRMRGRILVRVAEGPQYKAGGVVVDGTALFTPEQFAAKFAEPTPAARHWKVSWTPGAPAPLDQLSLYEFALRAREMFDALGRVDMDGTVEMEAGDRPDVRNLRVIVTNEGTPAAIVSVEVEGSAAVPADEIVERCGLKVGAVAAPGALAAAERLLSETGQFKSARARMLPNPQRGAAKIVIEVTEHPWAGPLSRKPSEKILALQRSREWFNHPERWEADVVLTVRPPDAKAPFVRAVWKPGAGLVADLRMPAGGPLKSPLAGKLLLQGGEIRWLSSATNSASEWKAPGFPRAQLTLEATGNPDKPLAFSFGASLSSGDAGEPLLVARMTPDAVYALENLCTLSADGKTLLCRSEMTAIAIDAAGGAVLSIDSPGIRCELVKGAYDEATAGALAQARALPSTDLPAPLAFARDLLNAATDAKNDAAPLVRALSNAAALAVVHLKPLFDGPPPDERPFVISVEPSRMDETTAMLLRAARFFPARTAPRAWLRNVAMHGSDGVRMNADGASNGAQMGPLGFLLFAAVAGRDDAPFAAHIAELGASSCNWNAFDAEVRALAEGESPFARVVAAILAAGAELTEQDLAGFSTLGATPSQRAAIVAAGRSLRENRAKPAPDALSDALKPLWPEIIRPNLLRELNRLTVPDKNNTGGALK